MSDPGKAPPTGRALATLALGALGVVYGDIGTSPLYALQGVLLRGPHGFPVNERNVLGILSLIVWSLNFVVTFKYLTMVMRADNRGEGGILALLALARPQRHAARRGRLLVAAGLFGAALLYGDGIITPAISVLSAVEGLSVATPALEHLVVPIAFVIILGVVLLSAARHGRRGRGVRPGHGRSGSSASRPSASPASSRTRPCSARINPWLRGGLLRARGDDRVSRCWRRSSWWSRAARRCTPTWGTSASAPIRLAWFAVVLPALVLNYFGQGALLLDHPAAARNPFYSLVPAWALYPMVALATAAAVVASQALISGAFSLTRQAVQLGYCPAGEHRAHVEDRDRADLRPRGQQPAHGRVPGAGRRLPLVGPARRPRTAWRSRAR